MKAPLEEQSIENKATFVHVLIALCFAIIGPNTLLISAPSRERTTEEPSGDGLHQSRCLWRMLHVDALCIQARTVGEGDKMLGSRIHWCRESVDKADTLQQHVAASCAALSSSGVPHANTTRNGALAAASLWRPTATILRMTVLSLAAH